MFFQGSPTAFPLWYLEALEVSMEHSGKRSVCSQWALRATWADSVSGIWEISVCWVPGLAVQELGWVRRCPWESWKPADGYSLGLEGLRDG